MPFTQQGRVVHLCLFTDSETSSLVPEQILHPVELQMYEAMSTGRKSDFLKGRYAIKSVFQDIHFNQMTHIHVAVTGLGKPYVSSNPELFCSISHSNGYVAAAISKQAAIGVDIERIKSRHPSLLQNISDAEEIGCLSSAYGPDIITTVLWSIKEAAAKADEHIYPRKDYKILLSDRVLVQRGYFSWDVTVKIFSDYVFVVALAITRK